MDTQILIVGAMMIAAAIAPFIFSAANRRKKAARLREALNKIAAQYRTQIGEYAHDDYVAIGMDTQAAYLFFLRHNQPAEEVHQTVPLSHIRTCECLIKKETVGSRSGSYEIITQIGIRLHAEKGHADTFLEFYNRSTREQLGNEQALAQQWTDLINKQLSKRAN